MEEESKKICNDCGILKPIYYIIDGMEFDFYVDIFSCMDAHIIFKNCAFKNPIKIYYANDIIFENNQYEYPYPLKKHEIYLTSKGPIDNIKFIDDKFINSNKKHPVKFGMKIKANKVEISDTNISGDDNSLVQIECNDLIIENSDIDCDEIVISSKKTNFYDLSTNANKGFIIDEDTMYVDFDQKKRKENSRINLINVLRNLRDKCNQDIENKLENKENKLKNKKIKKYYK